MDLSSPEVEQAAFWLGTFYEAGPDMDTSLGYRVPTKELYKRYRHWGRNGHEYVSLEDMWGIIQILWPWVTIVGAKGNRAFTGMREKK